MREGVWISGLRVHAAPRDLALPASVINQGESAQRNSLGPASETVPALDGKAG